MKLNRYEYKGNIYKVIDYKSYYKDSDKDVWFVVVVYKSLKNKKIYVRDVLDFDKKFKQLTLLYYIKEKL